MSEKKPCPQHIVNEIGNLMRGIKPGFEGYIRKNMKLTVTTVVPTAFFLEIGVPGRINRITFQNPDDLARYLTILYELIDENLGAAIDAMIESGNIVFKNNIAELG